MIKKQKLLDEQKKKDMEMLQVKSSVKHKSHTQQAKMAQEQASKLKRIRHEERKRLQMQQEQAKMQDAAK